MEKFITQFALEKSCIEINFMEKVRRARNLSDDFLPFHFYFKFSIIASTAFSTFSLDVARFIRINVP